MPGCSCNRKQGTGTNFATSREAISRCSGLSVDTELSSRHCGSQPGHTSLAFWLGASLVLLAQVQLLAADQLLQHGGLSPSKLETRGGRMHMGGHGASRRMLQDAWETDDQGSFGDGSTYDYGDYGGSQDYDDYGGSHDNGGYDDNDCSKDLEALFAADEGTGETFIPSALVHDEFGAVDWERLEIRVTCLEGRLQKLDMSETGTKARGPLPLSWSRLTELRHMKIVDNLFIGSLPPEYSTLTKLRKLTISSQQSITGSIPKEYSTLVRLKNLDLSYHFELSSTLPPEYSAMRDLESLNLDGSGVMGSLPPELSHIAGLYSLQCEGCSLTGPLPAGYSAMSSLEVIDLSGNSLTSTLPAEWSVLRLAALWVGGNPLQGTLPPEYSTMSETLENFGVGTAFVSGSLPPQWSTLSRMTYFDATNSEISGTLPQQFSAWKFLQMLDVSDNSLTGTLPPEYSEWGVLDYAGLTGNDLSGTLPPQWSLMAMLTHLNLEHNRFDGQIPQEWGFGAMPFLSFLFIDDENINPECREDWVPSGDETSCPFPPGVIYGQHLGYEYSGSGFIQTELTSWNVTVSCEIQSMEFHPDMMHSRMLLEVGDNLSPGALEAADLFLEDLAVFSGIPADEFGLLSAVEESGPLDSGGTLIGTVMLEIPSVDEQVVWDLTMALNMNPREVLPSLGDNGYYLQFVSAEYYPLYNTMDENADSDEDNSSPPSPAPVSIIITGAAIAGAVSAAIVTAGLVCVIFARRKNKVYASPPEEAPLYPSMKGQKGLEGDNSSQASSNSATSSGNSTFTYVKLDSTPAIHVSQCLSQIIVYSTRHAMGMAAYLPKQQPPSADLSTGALVACSLAVYWQWSRHILLLLATGLSFRFSSGNTGDRSLPSLVQRSKPPSGRRTGKLPNSQDTIRPAEVLGGKQASIDLQVDFNKELKGRLLHVLGEGGFGTVYKAHWRGMDVAVKMFGSANGMNKETQIQSFKAELKTMAMLTKGCNHIVRMHGACLQPPNVCIIYEFVPGGSLHDLIYKRSEPLSCLELLRIAKDIAEGMAFMHPRIVHRDLKPQNIMMDASGRAKICDLGLSKGKDPLQSYLVTSAGGTPAYMAPEMFTHGKIHDKADIYALGIIMNETLARQPPYDYEMPFQIIYAVSIRKERPSIPQHCPEALRRLIGKCWSGDVNRRPSALELVRLLEILIKEEEIKASVDASQ